MHETMVQLHEEFLRQIDLWQRETLAIQQELLALYDVKKQELARSRFEQMHTLVDREQELLTRYAQQHQQREKLLELLRRLAPETQTLLGWLKTIEHPDVSHVRASVVTIQQNNQRLREACWSMWIVSNRSQQFYGEMVELITFAGKKAPTYDQDFSSRHAASSLLDASV